MRATKKSLLLLSGLLVLCIALFLALRFAGREPPETAAESAYYFTNYASPESLLAVSVENAGGSIVLAHTNGTYRALSDYPVQGDEAEIADFFRSVCRLPLSRLVEGAAASDSQYGLTEPRATVLIQDGAQGGTMFLLGGEVPGGEGVYACLSGDQRVFVMDGSYARLFLSGVERFLDLRLYPSLEGAAVAELTEIAVRRDGETAYRLRQVSASESGTAYFALESPWSLLLGAGPVESALLTPLRQLEGAAVAEGDPASHGLTDRSDALSLRFRDGSTVTVLVGPRTGEYTLAAVEGGGVTLSVPTARLAFMDQSAADIMGGVLLKLNIHDIRTLTLNGHTYGIENSAGELRVTRDGAEYDAAGFQNTVFPALSHISIGGPCDGAAGEELLRLRIVSSVGEEEISLVFRRLDGRRCAVEINGQEALWCDLSAVSALLACG